MIQLLKLIADNGNEVELNMHEGILPYTTEEILATNKQVYEDMPYRFEVDEDLSVYSNVSVYVNDEPISTQCDGTIIYIAGKNAPEALRKLFRGCLGFVQIQIRLEDPFGNESLYCSEYASIMIKANMPKNQNVDAMLQYIYHNQKDFLYTKTNILSSGKQYDSTYNDFWAEIVFLEDIVGIYEHNVGYFRANSRFKLEQKDVVDSIVKMQYVNERSLRYIAQHPDLLRQNVTGIKLGKNSYLPDKTMMPQNQITKDIYENQVIVSFIKHLIYETDNLASSLNQFISKAVAPQSTQDDYVYSSSFFFSNIIDKLRSYRSEVENIKQRLERIHAVYSRILPVKEIDCSTQPKPTAVFLSVPQYNQIYTVIQKWYQKSGYDFASEKIMMNFLNIPTVYEIFVLVKLINLISSKGYELSESKKVRYPHINESFSIKEYNNVYTFRRENEEITLLYEPAIYDADMYHVNQLNLYRNNAMSFSKTTKEWSGNNEKWLDYEDYLLCYKYYVPDFVIKRKKSGKEQYVIMDAKFSKATKIMSDVLPEMILKYIFSLSPLTDNAEILGLNIFSGIPEWKQVKSVYENKVYERKVAPSVNIVPLTGEMEDEEHKRNLDRIWEELQVLL